jgi:hypothetical protein
MPNQMINTVKVKAVSGRSDELGKQLQKIVETLRDYRAASPIWSTVAPTTVIAGPSAPIGNPKRPCNRISTAPSAGIYRPDRLPTGQRRRLQQLSDSLRTRLKIAAFGSFYRAWVPLKVPEAAIFLPVNLTLVPDFPNIGRLFVMGGGLDWSHNSPIAGNEP